MDEKLTKPSDFEDPDSANHDRAYLKHSKRKTSSNHNPQHPRSDILPPAEKELSRVSDEVDTITGTGLETVAQTLCFTIYCLYSNPTLLHRLRTELRALFGSLGPEARREPTLAQLECPLYLTAVIMEGLRLNPGLTTQLARIAPDRELVFDVKWVISAGTSVSMTTLLMHWDESVSGRAKV
jgi:cytochrome P450